MRPVIGTFPIDIIYSCGITETKIARLNNGAFIGVNGCMKTSKISMVEKLYCLLLGIIINPHIFLQMVDCLLTRLSVLHIIRFFLF